MSDLENIKTIIRLFVREQLRYPKLLFGMLFTHPFAILFLRFLPALIIADILNRLSKQDFTKGDLWGSFGHNMLLAIALEAFGGIVLWRIVIYFNYKLEANVVRDLNRKVFNHLMRLSPSFHANHFGGSLVSQTSKLTGAYIRFTDSTVFQVLGVVWSLLFTSILLIHKAPVFVVLLVVFTVFYMSCAMLITRKVRRLNAEEAEASNDQTGQLADAVTNVMAIKGFAAGKMESDRFDDVSETARKATIKVMWATLKVESAFGTIGVSINALSLILATASIVMFHADIAVVFLMLNYAGDILTRLWDFSTQALRNYNRAFGDAQAMTEILAIEPEIKDPLHPEKSHIKQGAIAFKDVDFTHPDSRQGDTLFANLNLSIKPSEKIGLVGHSGSGKTTLTRLLLRFSDIDGGHILIDGQDITSITQDDLRRSIAYVPQEPLLFHRSIRENIAYGKPDATEAEIKLAAEKAYASEFIDKLPKGYDTLVGERGVKLSGGQRQRVVIARAILKDAPILVLDEATSALDSESEKLIQAALWQLMKGRTAIVIAHRLSTIQKMDRIIVLDQGEILEEGTHHSLLQHKGTYAKLWAHQSGGFLEEDAS
ncbi:MAG TPA: ABC transporter ATP-binding protein [Patescibacteria group bacterium]|nr:ABC transporter ATP-binding protein [Patescibacteria group bacterium]